MRPFQFNWVFILLCCILAYTSVTDGLIKALTPHIRHNPGSLHGSSKDALVSAAYYFHRLVPSISRRYSTTSHKSGRGLRKRQSTSSRFKIVHLNAQHAKACPIVHQTTDESHGQVESYKAPPPNYGDWKTRANSALHIAKVGKYLNSLDADVIHLCEIHDMFSLEQILRHFDAPEEYSIHIPKTPPSAHPESDRNNQCSAIITRCDLVTETFSFFENFSHKQKSIPFYGNIGGEFMIPGFKDPVTIFGLHLSCNPSLQVKQVDFLTQKLRSHLVKKSKHKSPLIIMGDFNCGDPAMGVSTKKQIMSGAVCEFRKLLCEINESFKLRNAFEIMHPRKPPLTHKAGLIDHMLVSETLFKRLDYVDIPSLKAQSLMYDYMLSDHAPIIASLDPSR
jgi:hypothetical protein